MVVRRGVATAAFAGLLIAPSLAVAQAFTVSPTIGASAGYAATRTLYDESGKSPEGRGAPVVTLDPAIAMTLETPRTIHELQAAVSATLPIRSNFSFAGVPPDLGGQLNYTSRFELSERWNLSLGGALSALPLNPFVPSTSAFTTTVDATPSTFSYNLSASAHETLTRELSPNTRITQTANIVYNVPYDPTPTPAETLPASTLTAKGALALAHSFALDTLAVTLTGGYARFEPSKSKSSDVPRTQLLNSLVATWQRQFTPLLTGSVDLGVLQVVNLEAPIDQLWQPTGGVRLAYDFDIATASIGYTHGAAVNVLDGTIDLSDTAVLRGAIPFGNTGVALSTSIGYSRTKPVFVDTTPSTAVAVKVPSDIYVADLGLTYAPPAVPVLLLGARGSVKRQVPVDEPAKAFTRLALNINVGFVFPSTKAAAAAQIRSSPAYVPTPTLGSDSTPAPGVQPRPIEVIEAQEGPASPASPLPEGRGGESLR